jgi:hypothetical protein
LQFGAGGGDHAVTEMVKKGNITACEASDSGENTNQPGTNEQLRHKEGKSHQNSFA